jgi:hypothetical protein
MAAGIAPSQRVSLSNAFASLGFHCGRLRHFSWLYTSRSQASGNDLVSQRRSRSHIGSSQRRRISSRSRSLPTPAVPRP